MPDSHSSRNALKAIYIAANSNIFSKSYIEKNSKKRFYNKMTCALFYYYSKHLRTLSPSKYFDVDFYKRVYGNNVSDGRYFYHYILKGWRLGYWPNPLFDPVFYRRKYAAIMGKNEEPLSHYVKKGHQNKLATCALFDPHIYYMVNTDVALAGAEPLRHYLEYGIKEGRKFHPLFDSEIYANNANTPLATQFPVWHYLNGGFRHGSPISHYFDTKYYLETYRDVKNADMDPLDHYIHFGRYEGRNPSRYFDTSYYLYENEDVAKSNINPLFHFALFGDAEGRKPNQYYNYKLDTSGADGFSEKMPTFTRFMNEPEEVRIKWGLGFDREYYSAANPDIPNNMSGIEHFQRYGKVRGFAPNATSIDARDLLMAHWQKNNSLTPRRRNKLHELFGGASASGLTGNAASAFQPYPKHVSFDVFDTLIERSSGSPETVFAIVSHRARNLLAGYRQRNFVQHRIEAESYARSRVLHREITLAEIYAVLGQNIGLDPEDTELIANIEADVEIEVAKPKKIGRILYEHFVAAGSNIVYLSDMYLPDEVVRAILNKCGYSENFDLQVSSSAGVTKHSGEAFKILINKLGVDNRDIIHIGDNEHSDVYVPKKIGIRAIGIKRAAEILPSVALREWYSSIPTPDRVWTAAVGGLVANHISQRGGTSNRIRDAAYSAGYEALGPVLLAFSQFVGKLSLQHRYARLCFASRDGYYLKLAYDALRAYDGKLPPSKYFLSSRLVARLASIHSLDDAIEVVEVDHHPVQIRKLLATRFRLSTKQLLEICARCGTSESYLDSIVYKSASDEVLREFISAGYREIQENADVQRARYIKYLSEFGFNEARTAIVDIGYRGTIQRAVGSITGSYPAGIYFATWPQARTLSGDGFKFDSFHSAETSEDPLVRYVQLFELMFSATHGTLLGFNEGEASGAELGAPDVSRLTSLTLSTLREGALDFVKDGHQQLASYGPIVQLPSSAEALRPLVELFRDPPAALIAGLAEHQFEDAFGGSHDRLIGRRPTSTSEKQEVGIWSEGTRALWSSKPVIATIDDNRPAVIDMFDGTTLFPARSDW